MSGIKYLDTAAKTTVHKPPIVTKVVGANCLPQNTTSCSDHFESCIEQAFDNTDRASTRVICFRQFRYCCLELRHSFQLCLCEGMSVPGVSVKGTHRR
jgi:hypothetical protein